MILKAPLRKRWEAAPAAADPLEKWLDCPPGLNKGEPIEEKICDGDLSSKHDCVGNCCIGGFQDVRTLKKKKKRREWRTLRFEGLEDVEICTVPVENEKVGNENEKD